MDLRGHSLRVWRVYRSFTALKASPPATVCRRLQAAKGLRELGLHGRWTSSEIQGVAKLKQIQVLSVDAREIGPEIFAIVGHLTELRELGMNYAKDVDAPAIEPLCHLHQLRKLKLMDASLSDAALRKIATMTQLEVLILYECAVSNDGPYQLQSLTNLKRLSIHPNFNKSAAEKLHELIPRCHIQGGQDGRTFGYDPVR